MGQSPIVDTFQIQPCSIEPMDSWEKEWVPNINDAIFLKAGDMIHLSKRPFHFLNEIHWSIFWGKTVDAEWMEVVFVIFLRGKTVNSKKGEKKETHETQQVPSLKLTVRT